MSSQKSDLYQNNCVHCGAGFIAIRRDKKFCSKSCKVSNHQMKERLNRVLTNDPGTGVMRHVDAGYKKAEIIAKERKLKIPMLNVN